MLHTSTEDNTAYIRFYIETQTLVVYFKLYREGYDCLWLEYTAYGGTPILNYYTNESDELQQYVVSTKDQLATLSSSLRTIHKILNDTCSREAGVPSHVR